MVIELLDKGADISARSVDRWTALHRATWNGHAEVARLLLERGAEANAQDTNGETILQQAAWRGYDTIVTLLLEAHVDANAEPRNGETALHWAASNEHNDIITLLVEHGAHISARDNSNETALDKAKEHKERATVDLLLQLQATDGRSIENEQTSRPLGVRVVSTLALQKSTEEACTAGANAPKSLSVTQEVSLESLDTAILASLSLESATTTVKSYGPPGFSKKAKILSVVDGVRKFYFLKKLLGSDVVNVFEGKLTKSAAFGD